MTVQDILSQFDDINYKGFNEHDIDSELLKLVPDNKDNIDSVLLSELMAFEFYENYTHENGWGTYFGPMMVFNNGDGTASEAPSIKRISPEMIAYWERRARESSNPILISRYSGLVWDFHQKITGTKPSHNICKIYIEAIVAIANGNFHKQEVETYKKLRRGLSIAISLNNKELITACKDALINYENEHSEDTKLGLWGHSFDLLIMGSKKVKLSEAETYGIINELENKLARLSDVNIEVENINIHAVEVAAERLAKYYKRHKRNDDVKRVILEVGKAYDRTYDYSSAVHNTVGFEYLHKLYLKFDLKKEAEEVLLKLRASGPKRVSELGKFTHTFETDNIEMENYLNEMTSGSIKEVLMRIVFQYIPVIQKVKEQVKDLSKEFPMKYLFRQQKIDKKGRIVAIIGSLQDDFEGHIIDQTSLNLSFESIYLRRLLQRAIDMLKLNKNEILKFIEDSPIINKDRLKIIDRGLDAYFSNDYLVAIHLIIPQIEDAIRNIIEVGGGNVMKLSKNGDAYQLRTFDEILRDDTVKTILGDDLASYFRVLFTDQRAWNLRNDVCHGLADPKAFNSQTADRVLHALLCLGLVVKKEKE